MAGISGKRAQVKVSGSGLSFTAEATTKVTANTVYQITDTAKRVWDRSATITVYKDAVAQAATLYTLNRLTGTVTFLADIGAAPAITVTGTYLPLSVAAEAKSYTYGIQKAALDDTAFGDTYETKLHGLKSASGRVGRWHTTDTYFSDALVAGAPVVIEFWSNSAGTFDVKMWAMLDSDSMSVALRGVNEEDVSFVGAADTDGRVVSG